VGAGVGSPCVGAGCKSVGLGTGDLVFGSGMGVGLCISAGGDGAGPRGLEDVIVLDKMRVKIIVRTIDAKTMTNAMGIPPILCICKHFFLRQ